MKHNGDINIESIDKISKTRTYHRIIIPGTQTGRSNNLDTDSPNPSSTIEQINLTNQIQLVTTTTAAAPVAPIAAQSSTASVVQSPSTSSSTSGTFSCVICHKITENSQQLMEHLRCHHSIARTPIEPISEPLMQTEMEIIKLPPATPPNQLIQLLNRKPTKFQCELCSFKAPCKSRLDTHMEVHMAPNDKPHQLEKIDEKNDCVVAIDLTKPNFTIESPKNWILFCKYCPARFFTEIDMEEHLKFHASWFPYRCSACTYTSRQESHIEAHADVHTSGYVKKSNKLIAEFEMHPDYMQVELLPMEIDGKESTKVWTVADYFHRRMAQQQKSTPANEMNTETVKEIDLDDMIEASRVPKKSYNGNEEPIKEDVAIESSPLALVSPVPLASSAAAEELPDVPIPFESTMEKQIKKIQETRKLALKSLPTPQTATAAAAMKPRDEKCPHCPFCTQKPEILKDHMQFHISVSGNENQVNCDHCDYSVSDETVLKDHIKLHFTMSTLRNVAFYTSYENLVLTNYGNCTIDGTSSSVSSALNGNADALDNNICRKTIYPIECSMECSSSDKENRILIDIKTGEVFK